MMMINNEISILNITIDYRHDMDKTQINIDFSDDTDNYQLWINSNLFNVRLKEDKADIRNRLHYILDAYFDGDDYQSFEEKN